MVDGLHNGIYLNFGSAVLDHPLHFFVDEFDAPQARLLQSPDLPLDEQLE